MENRQLSVLNLSVRMTGDSENQWAKYICVLGKLQHTLHKQASQCPDCRISCSSSSIKRISHLQLGDIVDHVQPNMLACSCLVTRHMLAEVVGEVYMHLLPGYE